MSTFLQYQLGMAMHDLASTGIADGQDSSAAVGFGTALGWSLPFLLLGARPSRVPGFPSPLVTGSRPGPRFCGHCGGGLVPHARFCGYCGRTIG
jgi:hypothetical protein